MILAPAQAQAMYAAMCALNNVSCTSGSELTFVGDKHAPLDPDDGGWHLLRLIEDAGGEITVQSGPQGRPTATEHHASQAAFASAYALI